jgi:hypothetical protein
LSPRFSSAPRIRTLPSCTPVSGSPTMRTPGSPEATSTSTSMGEASTPTTAAERTRVSTRGGQCQSDARDEACCFPEDLALRTPGSSVCRIGRPAGRPRDRELDRRPGTGGFPVKLRPAADGEFHAPHAAPGQPRSHRAARQDMTGTVERGVHVTSNDPVTINILHEKYGKARDRVARFNRGPGTRSPGCARQARRRSGLSLRATVDS